MEQVESKDRRGCYLVQLPGKAPKEVKFGTGWTGYGLRGQIADRFFAKGTNANTLKISVDGEDITDAPYERIGQVKSDQVIVVSQS